MFYDRDEIFRTEVLATEGTRILKLDAEGPERLATLKVSPDGETLAFGFKGELHLMSLSTGDVRLAPFVEKFGLLWCNVTSWSPDGQSLMLYAKGTGLVLSWTSHNILAENIVIPANFGLAGPDGEPVYEFQQVRAKADTWQRRGVTNENAELEVLSENATSYWVR
ncbi:MAG: hypothetical protein AB8C46_16810 [Burkholderiaceae bacterium]